MIYDIKFFHTIYSLSQYAQSKRCLEILGSLSVIKDLLLKYKTRERQDCKYQVTTN